MTASAPVLPVYDDVAKAADRLWRVAHRTPVVTSRTLDARTGARVFLKCESLQRGGAFKFRGAYNAIAALGEADRKRGVVAYSSGNHAQAVALAASLLGVSATIVMPRDAPRIKRQATEGYGARVVEYDRERESREEIARRLQEDEGRVLLPPYDHPDVIAGQGTAARELFDEVHDLDLVVVPCGGGGLLSGFGLVKEERRPSCRLVGVEPEAGDDATRSFRSGTLQTVANPKTIADGARTPSLGSLTFPLVKRTVDDMATVTDAQLVDAMRFLFERMKLVAEPTGVLGLAAILSGVVEARGQNVAVLVSGGNVDPETLLELLKTNN